MKVSDDKYKSQLEGSQDQTFLLIIKFKKVILISLSMAWNVFCFHLLSHIKIHCKLKIRIIKVMAIFINAVTSFARSFGAFCSKIKRC